MSAVMKSCIIKMMMPLWAMAERGIDKLDGEVLVPTSWDQEWGW
jgi:hypothetical protein